MDTTNELVEALRAIAGNLKYLDDIATALTSLSEIEFMARQTREGNQAIADSLSDIALALDEVAGAINRHGAAVSRPR